MEEYTGLYPEFLQVLPSQIYIWDDFPDLQGYKKRDREASLPVSMLAPLSTIVDGYNTTSSPREAGIRARIITSHTHPQLRAQRLQRVWETHHQWEAIIKRWEGTHNRSTSKRGEFQQREREREVKIPSVVLIYLQFMFLSVYNNSCNLLIHKYQNSTQKSWNQSRQDCPPRIGTHRCDEPSAVISGGLREQEQMSGC